MRLDKNIQTAAFLVSTVQSSGTAAPILLLTASDLQKIWSRDASFCLYGLTVCRYAVTSQLVQKICSSHATKGTGARLGAIIWVWSEQNSPASSSYRTILNYYKRSLLVGKTCPAMQALRVDEHKSSLWSTWNRVGSVYLWVKACIGCSFCPAELCVNSATKLLQPKGYWPLSSHAGWMS